MSFRYYALQTGETSLWPTSYLDVDKSQYLQHRKRTLSPKLYNLKGKASFNVDVYALVRYTYSLSKCNGISYIYP